jgi:hypothetical protein
MNPTLLGVEGFLTSTTFTPPPLGQFGAHAFRDPAEVGVAASAREVSIPERSPGLAHAVLRR